MAYLRAKTFKGKKGKERTYYYIVEGKNEKGKVKQKVLEYLGDTKKILEVYNFYKKTTK